MLERMHACSECTAEYTSQMAAEECAEDDRAQDLHNRQYFNKRS